MLKSRFIAALLLLLGFVACKNDEPKPEEMKITEISVSPREVTLTEGETLQLEVAWYPKEAQAIPPKYYSEKPEIATVDENGLITAVAVGETKINVKVAELEAACIVTVEKAQTPPPDPNMNEMPLIKFGTSNDPEILEHEKKQGREPMYIIYNNTEYPAFGNLQKTAITGALYNLRDAAGNDIIWAVSKEPVSDCPKSKKMLQEIGFTNLTVSEGEGITLITAVNDNDSDLKLMAQEAIIPELDGKMIISIYKKASTDYDKVKINNYYHEPTNVKDIGSIDMLLTKDLAQIKEFENTLGFRYYNGGDDMSEYPYYLFPTREDKIDESNFDYILYYCSPKTGSPYITSILTCIRDHTDLMSNQAFRKWLETNGFNKVEKATDDKGRERLHAYNEGKGYFAEIYIDGNHRVCYFILWEKTTKSQPLEEEELRSLTENVYNRILKH